MTTFLTTEEKAELRVACGGIATRVAWSSPVVLALLDEIDALRRRLKVPCAGCPGCGTGDCPDAVDTLDELRADFERASRVALGLDTSTPDLVDAILKARLRWAKEKA